MEIPWYFSILLTFRLLANGYVIEKGDSDLILNWSGDKDTGYNVVLKENNHIEGSDHLLLFTLNEVTSMPSWRFGPASSFVYKFQLKEGSSNDYEFYINQYMDYETEASHSYLLTSIIDSAEVISITLNTFNYDDESPSLTSPMCSMDENTNYTEENTRCKATLSDPDGWLSQTTFTIINSNPDSTEVMDQENNLFDFTFDKTISDTVYSTTVYLITLRELDYETKIFYSFVVQAKDGANHSTIPNEDVTCIVDVNDLNDMPPQWTDYFATKQITEKTSYHFTVTAVDGDRGINAPINYSLVSYDEDICTESCVSIATENGKGIITVNPIDRDAKDLSSYKFEIMAQEEDEPPYNITLTITFYLDDIDDNCPLFMNISRSNDTDIELIGKDPKVAAFTFFENFAGTIDGSIFIQDIDTGENAQFNVELKEDPSKTHDIEYTDAFFVVPTAGYRKGDFQITVKNHTYLDFENEPWQNFSFYVHSSGTKNASKEDELLVKIHLLDYNDELPIFKEVSYDTAVNETIKNGEYIITVKATDRDAEDANLTHQLVGADAIIKLMTIDTTEGIITVAADNAFDYDRINPLIFQVQAIDKVDHKTTVSVTVNLLDINNKAPTYNVKEVIRVDENQVIGIPLNATITASDVDTTRNLTAEIDWEKSYAMKNSQQLNKSNPDLQKAMRFLNLTYEKSSLDSISIKLIVNDANEEGTAPDYETFDTLYLDITITDLNTELPEFEAEMSIDALIVININDINDNAPIFTNDSINKNRTIYEKSKLGSIVGTIEAIDADVGDVVTYSCTYVVEDLDWFACDKTGQITASTTLIDADTKYNNNSLFYVGINCTATDGFWLTPQVFEIYILDTNDEIPDILINDTVPSAKVVEVYEKSDPDQYVTSIGYLDADRDVPFHTVKCIFERTEECYESFKIENNVVKVLIGGDDIDRDKKKKFYICTPTCYDNPDLEQSDIRNYPDATLSTFNITLLDINDHCPEVLPEQTSDLEARENMTEGDLIGIIVAEDLDDGNNSEIVMNILQVTKHEDNDDVDYTDQKLFIMEQDKDYYINSTWKQWNLVANKELRDYYGSYTVQLNLSDLGSPPISTEDPDRKAYKEKAKLPLTVLKYNYYPPVFVFPNKSKLNFVLGPDQEPGKPLSMFYKNETFANIQIKDGDGDESCLDKWVPEFNVELVDKSALLTNFFVIELLDRCIAQMQVNKSYDKTQAIEAANYQLRLTTTLAETVETGNEAKYSESIEFKFSFVDITENPVFNQDLGQWNISFREDDANQSEKLPDERKAFYPNIDETDDILKYYFLDSEDEIIFKTFEVEENSGTIKLKNKLNYLNKIEYQFDIVVSRNQSHYDVKDASRMGVNIQVLEINNHVPQWTQDEYFGALLRSTQKGSVVVSLMATDLDKIDEGKLKYYLNSTIQPSGSASLDGIDKEKAFLIDQKSGAITLNFQLDYNMNGYFSFWVKVQDVPDDYGNGPFENRTTVTIHIVTEDNTVAFNFENTLDAVVGKKLEVLKVVSDSLGWDCYDQSIDNYSENGVTFDNVTTANIYCRNDNTLLTADNIKTKLNNLKTFQQLRQGLLNNGIVLQTFNSDSTSVENLESTLKAALIGVSVVLGAFCLILGVTFFFKARELNRRLKNLTQQKFGSDESNLNRKGINAPNTNMFAVEGSNPVFNTEMTKDDLIRADTFSIHSGNSDLIGVEDSPEFDDMFGKEKF